jgi:pilus assembly protein Flp/PilA
VHQTQTPRDQDGGNELLALSICHENSAVRFTLAKLNYCTIACGRQKLPSTGQLARELSMGASITRFIRDESGATAIEYGLIAAGIAVAIIATVQALGTNLNTTFSTVSTALK